VKKIRAPILRDELEAGLDDYEDQRLYGVGCPSDYEFPLDPEDRALLDIDSEGLEYLFIGKLDLVNSGLPHQLTDHALSIGKLDRSNPNDTIMYRSARHDAVGYNPLTEQQVDEAISQYERSANLRIYQALERILGAKK